MVVIESDISVLPLYHIHGPHMSGWGFDQNIFHESKDGLHQCGLQPNCWTKYYLHQDTAKRFPFFKMPCMQWINKRKPLERNSKDRCKKKSRDPPSYQMQNSWNKPTNVYYYRRHEDLATVEKTYTMAGYFPFFL